MYPLSSSHSWDRLGGEVDVADHLWARWEPHVDDMSRVELVSQSSCNGSINGSSEMDRGRTIQFHQFGGVASVESRTPIKTAGLRTLVSSACECGPCS